MTQQANVGQRGFTAGETSGTPRLRLRTIGFFYLGLAAALPTLVDPDLWLVSLALGVALVLAWNGWRTIADWPEVGRYLPFAGLPIAFAVLSALSAWDGDSMYRAITFGVWIGVVVPGLASLLRDGSNRRALILGLIMGTAVYGIVAAFRLMSGQEVLDVKAVGDISNKIIGVGRNEVNMRVAVALPFLVWRLRSKPGSFLWWGLLGAIGFWLLVSGGRAGLLAGAFALLLFALLQPGLGRKTRALLVITLLSLTVMTTFRDTSGPVGEGIDRIASYLEGERTQSDEARELLVKKGWAIAKEHPIVGIGLNNFVGTDHPILRRARTPRIERIVREGVAHNTYVETLAEMGFVGGSTVFLLFAFVFVSGVRRSKHLEVRLPTASLGGMLLVIYFDTALSALLFTTLALVLGACGGVASARRRSANLERLASSP